MLAPWSVAWAEWTAAAFTAGYLERARGSKIIPANDADVQLLISFFLVELASELFCDICVLTAVFLILLKVGDLRECGQGDSVQLKFLIDEKQVDYGSCLMRTSWKV